MSVLWLDRENWQRAAKSADTVLTVAVIDPAVRVILPVVLLSKVSPNQVTLVRLGVAVATAGAFLLGAPAWAALGFLVWYYLDCIDGKLARLARVASPFGDWLDRTTDRLGIGAILVCEARYFVDAGMPTNAVWCAAIMGSWLYGITDWLMLERLDSRIVEDANSQPREKAGADCGRVSLTSPPGWYVAWCTSLARFRLTASVVGHVEWLILGICVAPATGNGVLLIISCCGILGLILVIHGAFWTRRWRQIIALGEGTAR